MIQAIIFIPPNLVLDGAYSNQCTAYIARRGYELVAVYRKWEDVEQVLKNGRAQVVIFADLSHIIAPVPLEVAPSAEATQRIKRCTPGRAKVRARNTGRADSNSARPVDPNRAIIFIPEGKADPHGARCVQYCEDRGLDLAGIVHGDFAAAIKMLADRDAGTLIVADEEHLNCGTAYPRIEIANQHDAAGNRRSRIIKRRETGGA
ncbi:hypothetical protein OHA21_43930 [Actinoplanes sp. NBC_00393]|uniref:hypothetical protein n=1 Tax=Actinoplanes sp. NBC_00393 TaxID=2975953 RepID=UPI002E23D239